VNAFKVTGSNAFFKSADGLTGSIKPEAPIHQPSAQTKISGPLLVNAAVLNCEVKSLFKTVT
jgi:hypothetical protein